MRKKIASAFFMICMLIMMPKVVFAETEAEMYVGGVGMSQGQYLLNGESEPVDTLPEDITAGYAHYENGVLTLNSFIYEGIGQEFYDGYIRAYATICCEEEIEIILVGESKIKNTEFDGIGIVSASGSVTVSGEGSIDINLTAGKGVYVGYDAFILNSGTVNITSSTEGIFSSGCVINGGTINIIRTNEIGMEVYGDVSITGGNVYIYNFGDTGIYAGEGNVEISGGDVTIEYGMIGIGTGAGSLTISGGNVNLNELYTACIEVLYNDLNFMGGTVNINVGQRGTNCIRVYYVEGEGNIYFGHVILQKPEEVVIAEMVDHQGYTFYGMENADGSKVKTIVIIPDPNPFTDVEKGRYYYDAVFWAVENEITYGMTDTTFEPDRGCTRAQIVTFLWRAYGCPAPTLEECPFTDVIEGRYYYEAVLWAVEAGITTGATSTIFDPDAECTREQTVAFLWRAEGKPEPAADDHPFTDINSEGFSYNAILWAVENGITSGMTETTFEPQAECTRAQVVTFLYRTLN